MTYQEVLHFWFEELEAKQWFSQSDELDNCIKERFSQLHEAASKGELFAWRQSLEGRLAEIIVLDQFSRNLFRGQKQAFAYDGMALILAQEMLKQDGFEQLPTAYKAFAYLPFMHSESVLIHEIAVSLFSEKGMELNYDFELQHKEIIDRFGRYPHRNHVLGRVSTEEEIAFLKYHKGF